MIPFGVVTMTIGKNDTVLGSDLVPQLCFWVARISDAAHVDRESVGMQRVELVGETANSESGRSISRENSCRRQPGAPRFPNCILQANGEFGINRKSTRLNSSHLGISY